MLHHLLPSRIRLLAATLLAVTLSSTAFAQNDQPAEESPYLTLVSNDGVSIEAEIMRIDGNNLFIRRKDGVEFNFPLNILDEKSRKLVQSWAVDHALANSLEIKVRERPLSRERQNTEATTGSLRTVQMNFTISNKSEVPVDKLRIEYRIYVAREQLAARNKDFVQEQIISGKEDLKPIPKLQELSVESEPIQLLEQKFSGNYVPAAGNNRSSQDKISGYWYRVYRGKNLIAEDASPRRLMRVKTW